MLSIVVLHYNNESLTRECLGYLLNQNLEGILHEVVVIDNGSEKPLGAFRDARVVRLEENIGNIGGQNKCFEYANGDWVLFVSNDVEYFDTNAIRWLWKHKFSGQLMPLILDPAPTWKIQSSGGDYVWPGYGINRTSASSFMLCDYCPSITYLMPKRLWEKVGGFDATLPMAYEDVDMGFKVECRCTDEAKVVHLGSATLKYTKKDRWRFHEGREKVILNNFSGINRCIRLKSMHAIDMFHNMIPVYK